MSINSWFCLVLLGQVLLLSVYYPNKLARRMRQVLDTYTPAQYPLLYPNPPEQYERGLQRFRFYTRFIALLGVVTVIALAMTPRSGEWDGPIATWLYMLQFLPFLVLDIKGLKELRLMRASDERSVRTADLKPRHFFDFASPALFATAVVTFLAFCAFIIWMNQFDYPWFGGYVNIAGAVVLNGFFGGLMLWHIYGKKLNPHQSTEDRMNNTALLTNVLLFVSIAATLFIAISIILSAMDLREYQGIVRSLYFSLLTMVCLQWRPLEDVNFEVYREEPLASQ